MAYINVDLDAISSAKKAVGSYRDTRKTIIGQMNSTVEGTVAGWSAEDQKAFLNQWNGMKTADGAITVTSDSLDGYHSLLSKALQIYKKAQSESVEQAAKL